MHALIIRPEPQCYHLATRCRQYHITASTLSCIDIIGHQLNSIAACDIAIFLSVHAVIHALPAWHNQATSVIAIGSATQRALAEHDIDSAIPKHPSSQGLIAMPELQADAIHGKKIQIICGENPKPLLYNTLKQYDCMVNYTFSYARSCPASFSPQDIDVIQSSDIIIATSKACFDNFHNRFETIPDWLQYKYWLSISKPLTQHIKAHGYRHIIESKNALNDSIISTLIDSKKLL